MTSNGGPSVMDSVSPAMNLDAKGTGVFIPLAGRGYHIVKNRLLRSQSSVSSKTRKDNRRASFACYEPTARATSADGSIPLRGPFDFPAAPSRNSFGYMGTSSSLPEPAATFATISSQTWTGGSAHAVPSPPPRQQPCEVPAPPPFDCCPLQPINEADVAALPDGCMEYSPMGCPPAAAAGEVLLCHSPSITPAQAPLQPDLVDLMSQLQLLLRKMGPEAAAAISARAAAAAAPPPPACLSSDQPAGNDNLGCASSQDHNRSILKSTLLAQLHQTQLHQALLQRQQQQQRQRSASYSFYSHTAASGPFFPPCNPGSSCYSSEGAYRTPPPAPSAAWAAAAAADKGQEPRFQPHASGRCSLDSVLPHLLSSQAHPGFSLLDQPAEEPPQLGPAFSSSSSGLTTELLATLGWGCPGQFIGGELPRGSAFDPGMGLGVPATSCWSIGDTSSLQSSDSGNVLLGPVDWLIPFDH